MQQEAVSTLESRRVPVPRTRRKLLVILPALNEGRTIARVIDRIPRDPPGVDEVQVVVIDDGSSDDTVAVARAAGADVVSHRTNMGVGRAMQTGLSEALRRGVDFAINIDADGQFAPEDIPKILAPLIGETADMVTASRFIDKALTPEMPFAKRWGNWGMSLLVSRLVRAKYHDVSCGFRGYSREAILRLVLTGRFTYTQESFLALSYRGLKIDEIPIAVRGVREFGKSRIASNLWKYGFLTSRIIFGTVRDYRPTAFFNIIALVLGVTGGALGAFFVGHRLVVGTFTPHIWSGFTAAFLLGLTVVLFVFGQIAGMLDRVSRLQEEQLYFIRKTLADDSRRDF